MKHKKVLGSTGLLLFYLGVFLVFIAPIVRLLFMSLKGSDGYGLSNYQVLLQEKRTREAIFNTILIAASSTMIAIVAGSGLALAAAYTNIKRKRLLELLVLLPFIIPSYIITLSWSGFLRKKGIVNQILGAVGIGPVNIYSIGGILLVIGICNGFQALVKLGLVPYGEIRDMDDKCPTLTYNTIGRHQSRYVTTRVASVQSPWMLKSSVGDLHTIPISHGEGKFLASEELIRQLAANGQIATQYVDLDGNATADVHFNPNGSLYAIEGITSPDGRVFGKMGHSERIGSGLYKNVPGEYNIRMFEAAVKYFR